MIARKINWLQVTESNMELVAKMFARDGFTLPSPRCFGKEVKSFDLTLRTEETLSVRKPQSQWKLAFDRIMSILF